MDIDPANEPDVVADCFYPYPAAREWKNVELIYACHVLEHCCRVNVVEVLGNWLEILKPGGILRLAVPDLSAVFKRYARDSHYHNKTEDLTELLGFLYGGQRNEHDYHKMGWDEATLTRDLKAVGFSEVRRWDWRTTEHAGVDDYSQSYLPHLKDCKSREEYEQGLHVSLNLEAVK